MQSWVGSAFLNKLLEVIDGNLVEEIRRKEDNEDWESHDVSEFMGHGIVVLLVMIGVMCTKCDLHEKLTLR